MIQKDYYCIIPKTMTLEQALEVIYSEDCEDPGYLSVHWTQKLDAWTSLETAKRAIARYTNGNTKRIIKYTETIEEVTL